MRKIAVINQKGGVGKTTTCCNVGAALAAAGQRVLLIDLDPQAHLTMHLGIEPSEERPCIYHVLTDNVPVADAIVPVCDTLHLVPSHIDLAAAEMELVSVMGREVVLRDALNHLDADYDFVMIDCPPSLGVLTINGLAAMREVIVPMQPHFLALQGVGKLLETIRLVKDRINSELVVSGIVLCMYDAGTRLASEVSADLTQFIEASRGTDVPWADACVFKTIIRRNIKLAECPSHGRTIADYAPSSNGAMDYASLAAEMLGVSELAVQPLVASAASGPHGGSYDVDDADESAAAEDTETEPVPAFEADGRVAFGPDDSCETEEATQASESEQASQTAVAQTIESEPAAAVHHEAAPPPPRAQRMSIPIAYEEDGAAASGAPSEAHHG